MRSLKIAVGMTCVLAISYVIFISSLFIGEWRPTSSKITQARVTSKRTHFGGTENDHFIMYMKVGNSVYKYHNVGKEVYTKFGVGDALPVFLVTYKNSVFGFTYRDISLSRPS